MFRSCFLCSTIRLDHFDVWLKARPARIVGQDIFPVYSNLDEQLLLCLVVDLSMIEPNSRTEHSSNL